MAVWTIVNLEVWDISRPMARQVLPPPMGQTRLPDVVNWSWHEYGMRVGVWRFFRLFARHRIRPTLAINARVCDERVAAEARDRGWEFMGHAWEQMPIHTVERQEEMILRCLERLERFTGSRPLGWLGPGLTQTEDTPDLLRKAGIRYIGDWLHDDEPTEIATAHGPLITPPYTAELNDIPAQIRSTTNPPTGRGAASTHWPAIWRKGRNGRRSWRSPSIPYISGVPHRIRYLEEVYDTLAATPGVIHMNGAELLAWYPGRRQRQLIRCGGVANPPAHARHRGTRRVAVPPARGEQPDGSMARSSFALPLDGAWPSPSLTRRAGQSAGRLPPYALPRAPASQAGKFNSIVTPFGSSRKI